MRHPWTTQAVTPEEAVSRIKSGDRVFVHGAAATPTALLDAMCARTDLHGVTLYHLHTEGHCAFAESADERRFRSVSLFVGPQLRAPVAEGRADFIPVFLSEIPDLFLSGVIPLDVALVQLSPPNRHGHC
ncbi:MAG TPA: 4-hydroxybutyrate CoA-transferase, partial [Labilithrix sp.]|nr:4-hydroxybutyrate CoA-transferase [Labilithrix sp.]